MTDTTLTRFAEELAHQAGIIMLDYFARTDMGVQTKGDSSPVTEADKKINHLVIRAVNAHFPVHGVLGEEESVRATASELWVCDPIDGTRGFILGVPTGMFSLAYVRDGIPQVAVIANPFINKVFVAEKGKGTRCNGMIVRVNQQKDLRGASLANVTSYTDIIKRRALFDDLKAQGAAVTIVHGNVFRSSLVAEGKLTGYIFPGKTAHDVAATQLIVEEAGGTVTDLAGKPQRYDQPIRGAIISNGHIHHQLVAAVEKFGVTKFMET